MGWKVIGMGRSMDNDEFEGHDDDMLEKAYRKGMKKGYHMAREEMEDDRYGERGGYGSGRGGYGERDGMFYDDDDDAYGERRGVKGTGPYSRVRRYRYR